MKNETTAVLLLRTELKAWNGVTQWLAVVVDHGAAVKYRPASLDPGWVTTSVEATSLKHIRVPKAPTAPKTNRNCPPANDHSKFSKLKIIKKKVWNRDISALEFSRSHNICLTNFKILVKLFLL